MVADSHSILTRWRNHGDDDVRQTKMCTAEPLAPEPSDFEVEMAIGQLKRCKSPGIGEFPAELIKAVVQQFALRSINLIPFGIRRNCLRSGRSQSLYVSTRRAIKQTVVIIEVCHLCQLHTKFYPTSLEPLGRRSC